jgi:hypothetical protein
MLDSTFSPDLTKLFQGNIRALQLFATRDHIRRLIAGPGGRPDWSKANELGKAQIMRMSASTIINFATGKTLRPDPWTIKILADVAGYELFLLPKGTIVPGAIRFE